MKTRKLKKVHYCDFKGGEFEKGWVKETHKEILESLIENSEEYAVHSRQSGCQIVIGIKFSHDNFEIIECYNGYTQTEYER